jgi:hypothetical protein
LPEIDLKNLLRKTGAILIFKIAMISLLIDPDTCRNNLFLSIKT